MIVLIATAAVAGAADWPQWRGPDRTEIAKETGLLKSWPASGPKLLWTFDKLGSGYSGPAVVGDVLYILGAVDGTEYAFAIDTNSGQQKWRTELAPEFKNGYGNGPRCTPTVDGEYLYVILGGGDLICLTRDGGKVAWKKNFRKDFGGQLMSGWGFSESPLIDGDMLICSPGGNEGTLAALNKKDGSVVWRSKEVTDPATYSSVIVADVDGVPQYIQTTKNGIIGVRAKDGKLLWNHVKNLPNEKEVYRTAVIPTPIYHDHHVFATAGYGAGCDLLRLSPDGKGGTKMTPVYANKTMTDHHGGVIFLNGFIYGHSDNGGWTCLEMKTGKPAWNESKKLEKGSITYAEGCFYCYGQSSGKCVRIEASPKAWIEKGSVTIPRKSEIRSKQGGIWTHPVIANGKLYLRDQDLLFCFDVSAK
jgi:outer membrane protein assembly factor BamB